MTAFAIRDAAALEPGVRRRCAALEVECDVERVGGKAQTLGRLMRAGVRVPSGFVLDTEAFEEHASRASVAFDAEDGGGARARIVAAAFDPSLREEVMALAAPLLSRGPVVVRSSAVGEDSSAASFAGQLDSILHVDSEAALERAVKACWASYWTDRAIFYRRAKGVSAGGMGVIVQSQVDAAAAGVMFTVFSNANCEVHAPRFARGDDERRATARGDDEPRALIEYTSGLGDALVAGAVDPGRISVSRSTQRVTQLLSCEADALVVPRMHELLKAAALVERELGAAQDVEWAMTAEGTLFVVQSRPITTVQADARRAIHWSNANVNENFPDPISPLLYSVASAGYSSYFRNLGRAFGISAKRLEAMEPAFAEIIGVHGARMYYNLTNIHAVIRLAPFGDALANSFDAFVGAEGEAATGSKPARRLTQVFELCRIGASVVRQYAIIERRIMKFEQRADEYAARAHPDRLAELELPELGQLLGDFMDIRCNQWKDASLADTAAMVCHGALQRVIAMAYPHGGGAAHTSLLKAIPHVVSNAPVHRLWELSRMIRADAPLAALVEREPAGVALRAIAREPQYGAFKQAFDAYIAEWGFRCSSELMLTVPSFQENPEPVLDMLRAYARLDAETPLEAMARQSDEREAETVRAMDTLRGMRIRLVPWLSWAAIFRVLLPWTHASIRYRERARLKQALLYSRLRRVALAVGGRLADNGVIDRVDDVFLFTMDELRSLAMLDLSAQGRARDVAAQRARVQAEQVALTPPDAFTLPEGESWSARHATREPLAVMEVGDSYAGTSACTGWVTGRAAVLRDVAEAERLREGDVLVTKQTDPGWGPVFFLISGLVIERGGMLSHGAILAREFGIPCVVGIRDATVVIPNGSMLTVDGERGRVHVAR